MTGLQLHKPVMLDEVLSVLRPSDGETYIDGTFGAGGYTRAILERADCKVIAIDRDPEAVARAGSLSREFGNRLVFIRGCFGNAAELIRAAGFEKVDGFVLDIGVSSMQFDDGARGFSFRHDAPLDMRMDTASGMTAADIVNDTEEEDLANLIYKYGEERKSRYIARRIAEDRKTARIETTFQLANLIRDVVYKSPKDKIDPATRTFQALRIAVNDELGELERGLHAAEEILKEGGRLAVVTFHSLEDGIVKEYLTGRGGKTAKPSRYAPAVETAPDATFTVSPRKHLKPTDIEISENPRARSAKLRGAIRTGAAISAKGGA